MPLSLALHRACQCRTASEIYTAFPYAHTDPVVCETAAWNIQRLCNDAQTATVARACELLRAADTIRRGILGPVAPPQIGPQDPAISNSHHVDARHNGPPYPAR